MLQIRKSPYELFFAFADSSGMNDAMPDPRTPVMIMVEVSWQDQSGDWQTVPARIEDKSSRGACIRVKTQFAPGAQVKIQWRFDQFFGTVKYCRGEGREYVVGIQRDLTKNATFDQPLAAPPSRPPLLNARVDNPGRSASDLENPLRNVDFPAVYTTKYPSPIDPQISAVPMEHPEWNDPTTAEIRPRPQLARVPVVRFTKPPIAMPVRPAPAETDGRHKPRLLKTPDHDATEFDAPRTPKLRRKRPAKRKEARNERKSMVRKWLDLPSWHKKNDASTDLGKQSNEPAWTAPREKENPMPNSNPPSDKFPMPPAREIQSFQVEMLSPQDIYAAAGIINSGKGYSVLKVVEMLNSEHIRALSKDLKRAAVLMALDAAGVSVEQVRQDARARQDALDSYETQQKKQAEAEWARRAEEITQIQAELESIKAHYMARINRNVEAVAREKARFTNWVATKQHETQTMAEAVELCLKSSSTESAGSTAQESAMSAAAGAGPTVKPT
jgi:hypothetical protein